ncbi:hypothetical protein D3OALGA1CA_297 [Olavius algarvensis associated proteobacterium Delta 3]|nr:hypothetical protein D3OALGA1CA_297 [Olavius algarvensis associated proteobacterium Delta 3]
MSVTIHLHKSQRHLADGKASVDVAGRTVNACLADLIQQYPDLESQLFENSRRLKKNVEIYLNLESAYPDELAKPVRDGDEIHITLILSGG